MLPLWDQRSPNPEVRRPWATREGARPNPPLCATSPRATGPISLRTSDVPPSAVEGRPRSDSPRPQLRLVTCLCALLSCNRTVGPTSKGLSRRASRRAARHQSATESGAGLPHIGWACDRRPSLQTRATVAPYETDGRPEVPTTEFRTAPRLPRRRQPPSSGERAAFPVAEVHHDSCGHLWPGRGGVGYRLHPCYFAHGAQPANHPRRAGTCGPDQDVLIKAYRRRCANGHGGRTGAATAGIGRQRGYP